MLKKYRVRDYDFKLIIMLIAITVVGILVIGSADRSYQSKQILGFVMGLFLMVVISLFEIRGYISPAGCSSISYQMVYNHQP